VRAGIITIVITAAEGSSRLEKRPADCGPFLIGTVIPDGARCAPIRKFELVLHRRFTARLSPMRNCASEVRRFASPRNDNGKIWHGRRCCGIEKAALDKARSLLASHPSAGDFFMRRIIVPVVAMLIASFAVAEAQQGLVRVGVLECRGGASIGFVVGSVTNLGCVLRVDNMPEDRYVATIRKVGLDLGITQETALAWAVYAPVAQLGPGDLSGDYAGAQGSATLGVGVGGNVLVGGSNNSIALQPLSLQGQVGINVAAGLESLELRPGR
jgi:hypothetical protein